MFTLIRPKIWGGPGLPGLLGDYIPAFGENSVNLGETPHHEAAVNGHSNESTCILNHLKSVHF